MRAKSSPIYATTSRAFPIRAAGTCRAADARGGESPLDCVLRETEEEFGLRLPPARITYQRFYPSREPHRNGSAFLAGTIGLDEIAAIRFGDEGQHWRMMDLYEFLTYPLGVPRLVERLGDALAAHP